MTIPLPGGPAGQGSGTEQQEQTLPFSKPSDFYPKGYYTHIRVLYVWIYFHFSLANYYNSWISYSMIKNVCTSDDQLLNYSILIAYFELNLSYYWNVSLC